MHIRWLLVLVFALAPLACGSDDGSGGPAAGRDVVAADTADGASSDDSQVDEVASSDVPSTEDAATEGLAADVPVPDAADDSSTPAEVTPDTADTAPDTTGPHDPKCDALVAGTVSNFDVDGKKRAFVLTLPGMGQPRKWPVVFNWHGFGDTAANMANLLSWAVNDATFPFILVTPDDTNLQPPSGMDWDLLKVVTPNQEARLFDEVLKCLDQQYGVDWTHVHSVGFSAGAIMTDLLGVLRGDVVASLVSFSGTYFSDKPNKDALGMLSSFISWPDPTTSNGYAQLLVHGGAADNYDMSVVKLQFDQNGQRDVGYLNGLGHDVIHCDHGQNHTIPQSFTSQMVVRFLEAHPKGAGSPWVDAGLPATYPAYCEMKPAL